MNEYPHQLYDEKGKVICQICGKSYLVISPKHLGKHNVKHSDYVKRFPNAPLSNKEFAARGKYGRNKDLFQSQGEVIGDDILVDEPVIEEINDVEEFIRTETKRNPMERMKARILDHLRLYFVNTKMDYLIREFGPIDGILKFEFITDFCDPTLKVVMQFPDTFWHNHDVNLDLNKVLKLRTHGWKVYVIHSANPSLAQIDDVLQDL
jgi:hypothetical protein